MVKAIKRRWQVYKWRRALEKNLQEHESLYDAALQQQTSFAGPKLAKQKLEIQSFLRDAREFYKSQTKKMKRKRR